MMRVFAVPAAISLVLLFLIVDDAAAREFNRRKRSNDMMQEMTRCAIGETLRSKIPGYGCHCHRIAPPSYYLIVDAVDKCCKDTHDCHRREFEKACSQFDVSPWDIVYRTKECEKNKQKCCELGQCEQTKTDLDRCGSRICECDYTFTQCVRKATINDEYVNYEGNCIPLTP